MSGTDSKKLPPVGVLLIGGFLGAGKTTLLQRLIRDPDIGPRLAVLVNELGPLGLDGELMSVASESASLKKVQLDSGCLCCTLKGELGEALLELARPAKGPPPEQIIVELSGAALASEVHFQISTQALDAPYYPDGLVCVVDAHQAARWLEESEALFLDQLSRADLVLLSKLDLATPAERESAEATIARVAPSARVVPCQFGDVAPSLLLGADFKPRVATRNTHVKALKGETVLFDRPLTAAALEGFLDDFAPALFRIKGIVDVIGPNGTAPVLVQCVGDQIDVTPWSQASGPRRLTLIAPADSVALVSALERLTAASYSRAC